jgi:purine-cytosine permease-like protein
MNTLLHRKSPSIGGRSPGSKRSVELSEKHSLALMGFFTTTGLLMVVADIFTNMVPMPAGLRFFWLAICVITFGLLLIGITLFFLSYRSKQTRPRH